MYILTKYVPSIKFCNVRCPQSTEFCRLDIYDLLRVYISCILLQLWGPKILIFGIVLQWKHFLELSVTSLAKNQGKLFRKA